MLQPPLNFDEVKTGYMYTGAFVGALAGFVMSGLFTDWSTAWLAKRNNGIFEPEFRMILVIPQLLFGCIGLYGFGVASADTHAYGWLLPDVFFGFVACGMVSCPMWALMISLLTQIHRSWELWHQLCTSQMHTPISKSRVSLACSSSRT